MLVVSIYKNLNPFKGNSERVKNIKANKDLDIKSRFTEKINSSKDALTEYLQQELFYEIIIEEFVHNLLDAYNITSKKDEFISDLCDSYHIRGTNGIRYSWTPIIEKYKKLA